MAIYTQDTILAGLARTLAAPLSTTAPKLTHLTRRGYHCIDIWGREGRRDAGRAFGGEKIIAAIRQTNPRPTLDRRRHGRERPPRPILNTVIDTHQVKHFRRHSPDLARPHRATGAPAVGPASEPRCDENEGGIRKTPRVNVRRNTGKPVPMERKESQDSRYLLSLFNLGNVLEAGPVEQSFPFLPVLAASLTWGAPSHFAAKFHINCVK
jgi:hypothetical protein